MKISCIELTLSEDTVMQVKPVNGQDEQRRC